MKRTFWVIWTIHRLERTTAALRRTQYTTHNLYNFEVLSTACEQALSSFEHDAEYTFRIEDSVGSDFVLESNQIFRII